MNIDWYVIASVAPLVATIVEIAKRTFGLPPRCRPWVAIAAGLCLTAVGTAAGIVPAPERTGWAMAAWVLLYGALAGVAAAGGFSAGRGLAAAIRGKAADD